MITNEQRGFMREVLYDFEYALAMDCEGLTTNPFIDRLVTIFETGEPDAEGRWVKKLDGSQPEAEEG